LGDHVPRIENPPFLRDPSTATRTVAALAGVLSGRKLRDAVRRADHGKWRTPERNILALLAADNRGRLDSLVPIRYARMLASPFAFLRGTASLMAFDLAKTPRTGLRVQACGDAHLLNFGAFATPERRIAFDINDFDETLPAPWEWDVKRLAASVVVAGRHLGAHESRCKAAAIATVTAYRQAILYLATLDPLNRWYQRIDAKSVAALEISEPDAQSEPASVGQFHRLIEQKERLWRIRDEPPLVFHPQRGDQTIHHLRQFLRHYRTTLADDRRLLFDSYHFVDVAFKVVGVGAVGRRAAVGLFVSSDGSPLLLQFKEAVRSVLERHAGRSAYKNHGQRVVEGQRLMQTASDVFLGWSRIDALDAEFYVRQLRDRKTAADVDAMKVKELGNYATCCGWALARAHAKATDPAPVAGYLGASGGFDSAIGKFAVAYADQTEADFETLRKAAKTGKIPVAKI
jgi:uncharacterized protein (DUF2252 family)